MEKIPRLDILIYAHDGRGLGHASRSIGVGMAVRRLFPELKVLFVTGCRMSQELIGAAPLDWLKLPSYETRVELGTSRGTVGRSNYSDAELGRLRVKQLQHLVELYRPRLVLVDHTPQGKHKELVPAMSAENNRDTLWVLGVRGVVGAVPQAQSELAVTLFAQHYHSLLWYGDSKVLGLSHMQLLQRRYATDPVECGYVLRLAEFALWNNRPPPAADPAGTIAVPWLGEESLRFLSSLAAALRKIPLSFGLWYLFIDTGAGPETRKVIEELYKEVENCRIEPPGAGYVPVLLHSKTAVVYGGYNSIMDILHARLPALIVCREMADEEQLIHLRRITAVTGGYLTMVSESQVEGEELAGHLLSSLRKGKAPPYDIVTDGASQAAQYLCRLLI